MKTLILTILITVSSLASACAWDTDCAIGSSCQIAPYQLYGVCMGGMQPGNSYDSKPTYQELDLTGTVGKTCSSDFNCGVGGSCVKDDLELYGVCQ